MVDAGSTAAKHRNSGEAQQSMEPGGPPRCTSRPIDVPPVAFAGSARGTRFARARRSHSGWVEHPECGEQCAAGTALPVQQTMGCRLCH